MPDRWALYDQVPSAQTAVAPAAWAAAEGPPGTGAKVRRRKIGTGASGLGTGGGVHCGRGGTTNAGTGVATGAGATTTGAATGGAVRTTVAGGAVVQPATMIATINAKNRERRAMRLLNDARRTNAPVSANRGAAISRAV